MNEHAGSYWVLVRKNCNVFHNSEASSGGTAERMIGWESDEKKREAGKSEKIGKSTKLINVKGRTQNITSKLGCIIHQTIYRLCKAGQRSRSTRFPSF